jgi:Lrp/AsnC family leucine-responsive transcriptional regulator
MPITLNQDQKLDAKDRAILKIIQRDAKLPQAEIAKQVGLSAAAVNERLRKLEHAGVVTGYVAIVSPRAVGVTIAAFVEVFIEHPRFEAAVLERILGLEEVQECHYVTGEFSLLLKVRVRDMETLQELLLRKLNAWEGVRQTRTVMVLSTLKEEHVVPTGSEGDTP